MLIAVVVSILLAWSVDRHRLQRKIDILDGRLKNVEWVPVLETEDSILAGRSTAGLRNQEGIPAIMSWRVDYEATKLKQEVDFTIVVYVRDWDQQRAHDILLSWWGEMIMQRSSPSATLASEARDKQE